MTSKPKRITLRFVIVANGKQIAAFDQRRDCEEFYYTRAASRPDVRYEAFDLLSPSRDPLPLNP